MGTKTYVNPFAKAIQEAEEHPVTAGGGLIESRKLQGIGSKFDALCQRMDTLIAQNPDFAGLEPVTDAVVNAGASSKGSIRLGTWARGATPGAKAANIVAYRSGSVVATNVPLAPVLEGL